MAWFFFSSIIKHQISNLNKDLSDVIVKYDALQNYKFRIWEFGYQVRKMIGILISSIEMYSCKITVVSMWTWSTLINSRVNFFIIIICFEWHIRISLFRHPYIPSNQYFNQFYCFLQINSTRA